MAVGEAGGAEKAVGVGKERGVKLVLAALSACFLFLSFADWDIWPFGFVFVVPLMMLAQRSESAKQAWWWSLLTGWAANFGGFYWISGLLVDFGQMPFAVALGICLLMNLYQGVSFAIFGTLFHVLDKRTKLPAILLAPVLWTSIELMFPLIFPYYLGNSQWTFPVMIQVAELLGPLSVGTVLFIANGAILDVLRAFGPLKSADGVDAALKRRAMICGGVGAAVVAANLVYGVVRMGQVDAQMEAAEKLKIGLVEADIGIFSKEDPFKLANNLIIHQHLSKKLVEEDKVDLLVWPESSFQAPYVFASTEKSEDLEVLKKSTREYRRWFPRNATYMHPSSAPLLKDDASDIDAGTKRSDRYAVQRGFKVPILFGGISFRVLSEEELRTNPPNKKMTRIVDGKRVRQPRNFRVYNTATLLDEEGRVKGSYDKTYLLAFGEYIPFADYFPSVYDMIPAASEFTPGDTITVMPFGDHRIGVMICYEDIIPAFGRKLAKEDPHVIINVTNDAWFGKTAEPYLHLALASFRSVETRKWLLRSTNTGVSAFIDANGRLREASSIYDAEGISYEVAMMTGGPTLYVMIGDVIGYLAVAMLAGLFVMARRREDEGDGAKADEAKGGESGDSEEAKEAA